MDDKLVSIITPLYNAEKYIAEAIESVLAQTYGHWELLIVDDASGDRSAEIARGYARRDKRIRLFLLKENSGAAAARNAALKEATGRFIAYLDADDLWHPEKILRQTGFMLEHGYAFSCTSYDVIGDSGKPLGKRVLMRDSLDYNGFLANNLIQTVGVMIDRKKVPGRLLVMPGLRRRQDAATWMRVLKAGFPCYGMSDALACYRHTAGSLSGNKIKAARSTWRLYRDVQNLPLPYACYCFARYSLLAVWKRIYSTRKLSG